MKPITEYQDYRHYMQDFYEEQKKSGFTWREFSKDAGFASPSYLKLVCEGKSSLSRVGVPRVAAAMKLSGFELAYFEKMVEFGNAANDEKKTAAFADLNRIAKEQKARVIDADMFNYYESAINSIVRELAPLMPGALPLEIAKKIKHAFTAQQVRDSLALLTKANFLKETAENTYQQTDKAITGSSEAIPLALRAMNREMSDLAKEAIDKIDVNERNISGVTMGINAETLTLISDEINNCRKRVIALANECKKIDQVYRLNLQLFPLTDKV
ncbi:TIGR02147 family protein [Fibrobacter sp.]|uniref:TIGR02147 family protein n=1 Tax=Fibrobacter sp. TaxID=35828 RepID=UPI0025C2110E|nr:TIGR02147 family protein [Fibrobacter sp.]MBR3073478.1 TIGR02147 family protein [Fibrobacter sp.]